MEINWIGPVLAIIGSILASVILERVLGEVLDKLLLDLLPNSARGRVFVFSILILCLAMVVDRLTSASAPDKAVMPVDITVKDFDSGRGIRRASVVIELVAGQDSQLYTNEQGIASFKIAQSLYGQTRPLVISAEGYANHTSNLYLIENENTIFLRPLPTPPESLTATLTMTQTLPLCPPQMQPIPHDADNFCLDSYEVSNGDYQQCVARGICRAIVHEENSSWPLGDSSYPINPLYINYPVVNVTVAQAANFCETYMKLQDKVYNLPKRLPTFEEWLAADRPHAPLQENSKQLLAVSDERLGKSQDAVWGLDSSVKEWVVVEQADNGPIRQAVAMGNSYTNAEFPSTRASIPKYEFVVDNEIDVIHRVDWGFRCAADLLPARE